MHCTSTAVLLQLRRWAEGRLTGGGLWIPQQFLGGRPYLESRGRGEADLAALHSWGKPPAWIPIQ